MRLATLDPENKTEIALASALARSPLLEIDGEAFRTQFDRRPFFIRHQLVGHPLFELPRLVELSRTLPEQNVEYNAGDLPIDCDPALTPKNGLSSEETIRRIEECRSWLVLKYVDQDPEYNDLLKRCLAEVQVHSDPMFPGMCQPESFIFITSPNAVTPYHMDPEHNFLLQIRGQKQVALFDPRDRELVTAEELERFYAGSHRNMTFKEEFQARAMVFDLKPGFGLHFPVTAPHYVKNGPGVSISFSITFRTPDLDRRSAVHLVNGFLRRRGLQPAFPGGSTWKDTLKYGTFRLARKLGKLVGKKI